MVRKALMLLSMGMAAGVAVDRTYRELQKPSSEQFPWLRARMNDTVNPWLMEHRIPGSEKAEIATLEHVGRTSGTVYFTPVHPTLREERVLVPAPMGVGSQWARNVLHAGHARLQLHENLYELDAPELITLAETGMFAPGLAAPFDRMGFRYVRFHLVASTPGTFATHATSMPGGVSMFEGTLDGVVPMSAEIPIEPRMVEREPASA